MGASQRDITIALMTALQESGLRNLKYGDRDSQGLFQQRPSQGWGSVAQVTNPEYASRKFFQALLADSNRGERSLTQAAQHVQRSAFPDAYAKHEGSARELLQQIGQGGGGVEAGGQGQQAAPAITPAAPSITPSQNLKAQLAQSIGLPEAPAVAGLGSTSNQADLTQTVPLEGQFEDPTDEDGEEGPQSLAIADVGEGADIAENPLETQYITANDADTQTLGDFSTGTPWRGTETDTGFVPIDAEGGAYGGSGGGGGNSQAGAVASKFLGTPYVWGASSPLGFDCSGLTSYVFEQMGISLPRASVDQSRGGQGVAMSDIQPGDLLFWDASSRNGTGADHVAIFVGDGMMIEANGPRGRVVKTAVRDGAWARRYT